MAHVRADIVNTPNELTRITGTRIGMFAYPNGRLGDDFTDVHGEIVRDCGFDVAVTTHAGAVNRERELYRLPRFTPWDRTHQRFALRLARNLAS